jgi:mycofactocin precursor
MTEPTAPTAPEVTPGSEAASDSGALVEADLLVEDVSIDGMCGVY